jgi:hypothetical protein
MLGVLAMVGWGAQEEAPVDLTRIVFAVALHIDRVVILEE